MSGTVRRMRGRLGVLQVLVLGLVSCTGCQQDQAIGNGPTSRPMSQEEAARGLGVPKELSLDLGGGVSMKLVLIPSGTFIMGSPWYEKDRRLEEGPQHEVTISRPFYMGVYEVTQQQYERVMGENPSQHKTIRGWEAEYRIDVMNANPARHSGGRNPVDSVQWEAAAEFCLKLSETVGRRVRLPTEAEWEYACRAGTSTAFNTGQTLSPDQASYNFNYERPHGASWPTETVPVGSFKPNAWGLYDMPGNVFEWCSDWSDEGYYAKSVKVDPRGPATGRLRVLRGGAYLFPVRFCRSASRYDLSLRNGAADDCLGFRVVVDLSTGAKGPVTADAGSRAEGTGGGPLAAPASATAPAGAATPRQAVLNYLHALDTDDKALAAQSVDAAQEDRPILDAMVHLGFTTTTFHKRMTSAYGPDAMKGLNLSPQALGGTFTIAEEDDRATATFEGVEGSVHLVRKDGVWKIEMPWPIPSDAAGRRRLLTALTAVAKATEEVTPNIGTPGYDPQTILDEISRKVNALRIAESETLRAEMDGKVSNESEKKGVEKGKTPP
ncbi:MAG: formylglycine-generating enzyme family protein [Planctomycetota bacterium]|nr:formylglycine-generating enzyme family protein [Planctomycetota bacterium]